MRLILSFWGIAFLFTGAASASPVSLDTVSRGWVTEYGKICSTCNYLAGGFYNESNGFRNEYRNWFAFDLSSIDQPIVSATLRISNNWAGLISPDPTETYTVVELTTDYSEFDGVFVDDNTTLYGPFAHLFDDAGSGTEVGEFELSDQSRTPEQEYTEIIFNSDGLAILNASSGFVSLGGSITTLEDNYTATQNIWSQQGGSIELVVTTVPVPAAVWLFGSGLGLLGWMRRRVS